MTCHYCRAIAQRFGYDRKRNQRFRCLQCGKTFIESQRKPLDDMRIPIEKAMLCLQLLVEGCSIRSISRITGINKNTVISLLLTAGEKCQRVMRDKVKNVSLQFVEADEIWGFVQRKNRHVKEDDPDRDRVGDAYTFVAIEAKSKLVICYELGRRDIPTATRFIQKLQDAASDRFQLTTDGLKAYIEAVESVFGTEIDFAQLVKSYKSDDGGNAERRYSPGDFIGSKKVTVMGQPNEDKINTAYVERQNLTMRMMMRRLTRLTNAFSKKWENLDKALALHFAYYNFCRIHQTLRVTPAMEAGLTDRVWDMIDLLTV
ncbi:MAG TPA: IS1 family transposase [Blastocatellia bacterium]|nr:IS1 family transposase [Blastocatellia bacterium]